MSVTRQNFSHGSHEDHEKVIDMIRSIVRQQDRLVAILVYLQRPKILTAKLIRYYKKLIENLVMWRSSEVILQD